MQKPRPRVGGGCSSYQGTFYEEETHVGVARGTAPEIEGVVAEFRAIDDTAAEKRERDTKKLGRNTSTAGQQQQEQQKGWPLCSRTD